MWLLFFVNCYLWMPFVDQACSHDNHAPLRCSLLFIQMFRSLEQPCNYIHTLLFIRMTPGALPDYIVGPLSRSLFQNTLEHRYYVLDIKGCQGIKAPENNVTRLYNSIKTCISGPVFWKLAVARRWPMWRWQKGCWSKTQQGQRYKTGC